MKTHRYLIFALAWFCLASCIGSSLAWAQDRHPNPVASDPLGKANRLPADLELKVGMLRADLEANGFAVRRGYWTLWGIDDCKYPIQTIGYCYGNNPTAPYVTAVVPQWEDEFFDQRFHHIMNEPERHMSTTYRLDTREALVIAIQLPPPGRYFGIQSNVFTREAEFNEQDPILYFVKNDPMLQGILYGGSPDASRRMMMASIGNSTNNVVISEQIQKSPWNEQAYLVIVSDEEMKTTITDALVRAGAPLSHIFFEPIAPDLVRLGLDHSADDLVTYIRYAMPIDRAAGERWRRELPLTILRVRDMSSRQYHDPIPIPAYEDRKTNFDETALAADFKKLQDAVIALWGQDDRIAVPFFSAYRALDLVGQHCLGYGYPNPSVTRGPMDCLGDTQDADYQISQLSAQIDDGQVVALVGVLSTNSGNATYTSLSANWFPQLVGVANIDDETLEGTAASFASALTNDSALFYVYYVARDCTGLPDCVEISTSLVPNGGYLKFIQRNYVNPGWRRGPEPIKILNPVAILFDGRNRPVMK